MTQESWARWYTMGYMRWVVGIFVGIVIGVSAAILVVGQKTPVISPIITSLARPLDRYTIPNLQKTVFKPSQIILDGATATTSAYTVYAFHFYTENPTSPGLRGARKVTGVAHIPKSSTPVDGYPVIVQFRGYVDRTTYHPGEGTEHSAEVFAANGFISLAPDFLGYGGSDMPGSDIFEERFQTYTTALTLLASVGTLPAADASHIGIWGHSNGGQIALTVLEAVDKAYPASLWAPVTKPFPYSVLYYTDGSDDRGKLLRRELAKFESLYDVELYSLTNFIKNLTGPLQIHQGDSDDAIPIQWTDDFVKLLQDKNINVEYFTYPGSNHDLTPGWDTVIMRDVRFFTKHWLLRESK